VTPTSFGTVDLPRLPAFEDFHMTSRFPGPWRIAEFPKRICRPMTPLASNSAFSMAGPTRNPLGQTGFLMVDEARQIAVDFARPAGTAQAELRIEARSPLPRKTINSPSSKPNSLTARCAGNFAFTSRRPGVLEVEFRDDSLPPRGCRLDSMYTRKAVRKQRSPLGGIGWSTGRP